MISKEHKLCERKCDSSIRGHSAMNLVIIKSSRDLARNCVTTTQGAARRGHRFMGMVLPKLVWRTKFSSCK